MNAAKTTSERVDKLRKDRAALGLKRKEVYVHDDDWHELLKLAKRLERRRANCWQVVPANVEVSGPGTGSA